jgi:predicted nucleic acid-binding protein
LIGGPLYLADTNVLLRLTKRDDPKYDLVRKAANSFKLKGIGLAYTFQNMTEMWNTSTRPLQRNGFGLTLEETEANACEIELSFKFLIDNADVYREWRRIVLEHGVSGVQVQDARLAAAMYAHGLTHLLTFHGSDFSRFSGITAIHPANV